MTDSGLISLSGFSYQIKVLILYMSKLVSDSQIEFETLEDISIKDNKFNTDHFISKPENFSTLLKDDTTYEVIQVKQTKLTDAVRKKILFNWFILEDTYSYKISKYIFFYDSEYGSDNVLFSLKTKDLYDEIMKSDKKSNALISIVKKKYNNNYDKFEKSFKSIISKAELNTADDLDSKIFDAYSETFRRDALKPMRYTARISEYMNMIIGDIIKKASKREPYICTKKHMMIMVENICERITNDRFEPNFICFKKSTKINLLDELITNSREYKQLKTCSLDDRLIEEHLLFQEYYNHIRTRSLLDRQDEKIESIEERTYGNFTDVVLELQEDDKDTPTKRLVKTKAKGNSYCFNDELKYGSCVYLTKNSIPSQQKISWEDDEK